MANRESVSVVRDAARRFMTRLFVVSVAVNAVLGVSALLSGEFGDTEGKVLITSFLVSAAMLAVLINSRAIGSRVLWPVPVAAACVLVAGIALLIVGIWAEIDNDLMPKAVLSALTIGGVGTTLGLIAGIVRSRPLVLLRLLHALFMSAALGMALVMLWTERASDAAARVLGVACVVAAGLTLVIPVLSRTKPGIDSAERGEVGGFCPRCGTPLEGLTSWDEVQDCHRCGASFQVMMVPNATAGMVRG